MRQIRIAASGLLLSLSVAAIPQLRAATTNADCNAGAAIGSVVASAKPGDVLLVQGTCRENLVIQSEVQRITLDGQDTTTIDAPDLRRPAVQVLGREVTIKGFTVTGGTFGIAINRGATAIIERNTARNAAISGFEVSQNSFARIINNTVERNQQTGILVLGSASAHIGVLNTDDSTRARMSSGTMERMVSRCCGLPPPALSATRSAGTGATA